MVSMQACDTFPCAQRYTADNVAQRGGQAGHAWQEITAPVLIAEADNLQAWLHHNSELVEWAV